METIEIKRGQLKRLAVLELSNNAFNSESILYYVPGRNVVLKQFLCSEEVASNKLYTLNELDRQRLNIGINELVMPIQIAHFFDGTYGTIMPNIPNINLVDILDYDMFSEEQKIRYLQEVGLILEKMKALRENGLPGFYLNDIHESNFILNTITGRINAVDLDSAKIGDNKVFPSKYLCPSGLIIYSSKYVEERNSINGLYRVDDNTEIYCYIMMILQFLYGKDILFITLNEFYAYLEYMAKLGISKELIDNLARIVSEDDNVNPRELISELTPYTRALHKNNFVNKSC